MALAALPEPAWVAPWARMRRARLHLDMGDPSMARALVAEPTPAAVTADAEWVRFMDGLRRDLNALPR